jgi:hypothetical protein
MARLRKNGWDYFPMDVDFSEDLKIRKLVFYCGNIGEQLVTDIYRYIYKNIYFVKCDDDLKFILAEKRKLDVSVVESVISRSLEFNIFDIGLFENHKILTSNGVQERVYEMVKNGRSKVNLDVRYIINKHLLSMAGDKNLFRDGESGINAKRILQHENLGYNICFPYELRIKAFIIFRFLYEHLFGGNLKLKILMKFH